MNKEINYNKIIKDKFNRTHQSLGYFCISYRIEENKIFIFTYFVSQTDINKWEEEKGEDVCCYDYINDEIELYKTLDIELADYLINEVFFEIWKEIKHIGKYLGEQYTLKELGLFEDE